MQLSDKARKFIAKNPTLIGVVLGYRFYEHPTYGDEHCLMMITPEGKVKSSGWHDVPTLDELMSDLGLSF
jgi:hypothetical protein